MEPPSTPRISILNKTGRRIRLEPLRRGADAALRCHGLSGNACFLLSGDAEIQALNSRFRGVDEPTDVLTFPATNPPHLPSRVVPSLGDIAISIEAAERQAAARGIPIEVELAHLAIHGALHLAGFDDQTDSDHKAMILEMARVATIAGIEPDPEWSTLPVHRQSASAGAEA